MPEKIKAYEMELVFTGSMGMKEVNASLRKYGSEDTYLFKDTLEIKFKWMEPVFCDDIYIQDMAEALLEFCVTKHNLTDCRFIRGICQEVEVDPDE